MLAYLSASARIIDNNINERNRGKTWVSGKSKNDSYDNNIIVVIMD